MKDRGQNLKKAALGKGTWPKRRPDDLPVVDMTALGEVGGGALNSLRLALAHKGET